MLRPTPAAIRTIAARPRSTARRAVARSVALLREDRRRWSSRPTIAEDHQVDPDQRGERPVERPQRVVDGDVRAWPRFVHYQRRCRSVARRADSAPSTCSARVSHSSSVRSRSSLTALRAARRGRRPSRSRWRASASSSCSASSRSSSLPTCRSSRASSLRAARLGRGSPVPRRRRAGRVADAGAAGPARRPGPGTRRPAGQVDEPAVAEHAVHRVGDPLDQVAVVAGDDERARPGVEQVLQRGQRVGVQVVGRLVEQQHVRLAGQQPQHLQPAPLAAGQVADRGPQSGASVEAEHLGELGRGQLPAAEHDPPGDLLDGLQHPQVGRAARRVPGTGTPSVRSSRSHQPPGVRRASRPASSRSSVVLPAPFAPEDGDPVARADLPGQVVGGSASAPAVQGDVRPGRTPACRAGRWPAAAATRCRGAAARRRSARWRRRCGTAAWRCGPAGRGAARRSPCAAGSAGAPRWPPRPARARRGPASTRRSRPRTPGRSRRRPPRSLVQTASRNHRSWVTTTSAPRRPSRWRASQSMPATSRWLVGSSRTSRSAGRTSSAASATRRRSPPDIGPTGWSSPRCGMPRPSRIAADAGVAGPLVLGAETLGRARRCRCTTSRTVASGAKVEGLRQGGDPQVAALGDPARRRAPRPGEQPQQRRLAGAVEADHADPVGVVEAERDVGQQRAGRAVRPWTTRSRLTMFAIRRLRAPGHRAR